MKNAEINFFFLKSSVVYLFELSSGKPVGDGKPFVHQVSSNVCAKLLIKKHNFLITNLSLIISPYIQQHYKTFNKIIPSLSNFLASLQMEIVEVSLDKTGSATERRMTVVDRNRNVFLVQVRTFGSLRKIVKLGW